MRTSTSFMMFSKSLTLQKLSNISRARKLPNVLGLIQSPAFIARI